MLKVASPPVVFAHRGASGYEPENTLRSFYKALSLGVMKLELDVHYCKTPGQLIVIHDETLDRTTNGKGPVKEKTLAELKQYDAGKGEKLPTLEEVLLFVDAWYKQQNNPQEILSQIEIDIEIKDNAAKIVSDLIKEFVTKKGWKKNNFYVSSFNHDEIKKFRLLQPTIRTGALVDKPEKLDAKFGEELGAYFVGINLESVTESFVQDAHQRNLRTYVYTVNNDSDIIHMKQLHVDGIFSNYPDKRVLLYES